MAARYSGEERLPDPGALVYPHEFRQKQDANLFGGYACVAAIILAIIGLSADQPIVFGVATLGLIAAVAVMVVVSVSTAPAIADFSALRARCEAAHARLHGDSLDPEYRSTINAMINCDEGTLAYCAAKIASEIQRQVALESAGLEVIAIDLWDELDAIGASAREIAEDREETESLDRSRLRDDREVGETIAADKQMRDAAIALLSARVYAFADYRDRLHRLGTAVLRESRINSRAIRLAADELAANRLR